MISRRQAKAGRKVRINPDCVSAVTRTCRAGDKFYGAAGVEIEAALYDRLTRTEGTIFTTSRDSVLVCWPEFENGIWINIEYLDVVPKPGKVKASDAKTQSR